MPSASTPRVDAWWTDQRLQVRLIALVSCIVATFATGQPSDLAAPDLIYRAIIGGVTVLAVAAAPRWVVITVATPACAFVGASLWLISAVIGLALAIRAALSPRRNRVNSALSAAFAVQALLRLPAFGFFGFQSLVVGLVVALGWWFGYRNAPRRTRRIVRLVTASTGLVLAVILLAGAAVLLQARTEVDRGVDAARRGLAAARAGESDRVIDELGVAAEALTKAEDSLDGIFARPLRLVPVVGQNYNAIATSASAGAKIARQARETTRNADIASFSMAGGQVDLDLLAKMQPDLERTVVEIDVGLREIDSVALSPWILPPLSSRIESLARDIRDAQSDATLAVDATKVLPGLLGQERPRRYFVAFGSPGESRELGGLLGSWTLLEFDRGEMRQVDSGRSNALVDVANANEPLSSQNYPDWFVGARPQTFPQNLTSSPELSVVAAASRELLDGLAGGSIDGFVYLDAYAVAAALELTGPVSVGGRTEDLTAANAVSFLLDEQYRVGSDGSRVEAQNLRSEVFEELAFTLDGVLDGLAERALPGPERLGSVLGPAARAGRLQVATFDEAENEFLRSVKLQRRFAWSQATADSIAVVQKNGSASKLDLYLHREVTYDVEVDATGQLAATTTIELTSSVPADAPAYALGIDPIGENLVVLSVYSPHPLRAVRLDGVSVPFAVAEEFGYLRYQVEVALPANFSRVVEFDLEGRVDPNRPYELSIWHQPLVNDDTFRVTYNGPEGVSAKAFELVEETVFIAND